jgi:hypothetical protein
VGCPTDLRGEVPGERTPVIRNDYDYDDNDYNNNNNKFGLHSKTDSHLK